jgi:hypothetical protein
MRTHAAACWSRRDFLHGLTMAGMATLLGLHARPAAAELPPETTTLRVTQAPSLCQAPQLVAEELLRGEGFSDLTYVNRFLVDKGYTPRYDYALETLQDIPYGKWREYDPEDTIRFYALRLHELGMIKSSPQKILAQGTDFSFLKELKKELKG